MNGCVNGGSAESLRGNCARGRRQELERNDSAAVPRESSPRFPAALRPCQGNAKRRPELRRGPRRPGTQRVPPRLPAAPPRPACASRRRRPSRSRSAPRTAFPPLPSARYCFRVQKPPIRAAAQRRQFRDQTPPPEAEWEGTGPAPWVRVCRALTPEVPPGPVHCPGPRPGAPEMIEFGSPDALQTSSSGAYCWPGVSCDAASLQHFRFLLLCSFKELVFCTPSFTLPCYTITVYRQFRFC